MKQDKPDKPAKAGKSEEVEPVKVPGRPDETAWAPVRTVKQKNLSKKVETGPEKQESERKAPDPKDREEAPGRPPGSRSRPRKVQAGAGEEEQEAVKGKSKPVETEDLKEEPSSKQPRLAGSSGEKKKLPAIQVYARKLSADIGPRQVGSPAEQRAASYIEKVMSAKGAEVSVEAFRSPRSNLPTQLVANALPLFGVLLFPVSVPLAFILVFLGFFIYQLHIYRINPLKILQERPETANIITRIEPTEPSGKNGAKLVFISHYDSPITVRSRIPFAIWLERIASKLGALSLALLFMLYVVGLAAYVLKAQKGMQDWVWGLSIPVALPVLAGTLLSAEKLWRGKPSPGANDNASGIAVLLSLHRRYTKHPPQDTELWFVATGGGASCSAGVANLVRRHRGELKKAYFINIEEVGRKQLLCLKREGSVFSFRASRKLLGMARRVAFRHTQFGTEFVRGGCRRHEGLKLLTKQRRVLTVTSCPVGRSATRARADDYDHLDVQAMRRAYEFIHALADNFDRAMRDAQS